MGEDPDSVASKTLFNLNDLICFIVLYNLSDFNNAMTFPLAARRQNVFGK